MHKLLIVSWFMVVVTGCDGGFCNDSEGLGPGLIVLRNDGFVIPTVYGALGSTPERVFPYEEGSPFLKCRAIGSLRFAGGEAVLDSDHYPELESLGGISVEVDDILGAVEGFDGVIQLGGIGNPFGGFASISIITGFNGVEHITGSLQTTSDIWGFERLHEIEGSLTASSMRHSNVLERVGGSFRLGSDDWNLDLSSLREVGGDLLVQATPVWELDFPALTRIGGDLTISGNGSLQTWFGLAAGSVIEGNFEGTSNRPISDDVFDGWLERNNTFITGTTRICGNGREGEGRSCNDF